jgi:hypothetical protein
LCTSGWRNRRNIDLFDQFGQTGGDPWGRQYL